MPVCINNNCRRGLDDAWAFCPICGTDNRPPRGRRPVIVCQHLYLQGTSFCPVCGQPLAALAPPVAAPGFAPPLPPPTLPPARKSGSNLVLLAVLGVPACCFILVVIAAITSLAGPSAPPAPCGLLTIGMTEENATAIMGKPWRRTFVEPEQNYPGGWSLDWPIGIGHDWRSSCIAFITDDGLDAAYYITKDGQGLSKMSGYNKGEWSTPERLTKD